MDYTYGKKRENTSYWIQPRSSYFHISKKG